MEANPRTPGRVGLGLFGLTVAFSAAILVLIPVAGRIGSSEAPRAAAAAITGTILASVGALLLRHVPRNLIGWFLCVAGIGLTLTEAGAMYGLHSYSIAVTPALGRIGLWSYWTAYLSLDVLLTGVILLFPDGHLASRRWRTAAWVTGGVVSMTLLLVIVSGFPTAAHLHVNPWTNIPAGETLGSGLTDWSTTIFFPVLFASAAVSVASIVSRSRRASGLERQQVKWFTVAGAFVVLAGFAPHLFLAEVAGGAASSTWVTVTNATFVLSLAAIPVATAFAVLKYRLYDIDVVINRTLVYLALGAFITAVYVSIAVGIGALVGGGGKPNLGLSILATAIVAVGFHPVRERVQRVANRLVYGKRATPYEVLSQFSVRVAESYAADEVMPQMARVLAEGTGAQRADVWVRSGKVWREAAVWPADAAPAEQVVAADGELPPADVASRLVEVRHQGDLLGALSVTKPSGESLTPVEENLLTHLAGQAGLVLKNVGLSSDLRARVEELRASRQRLVTAQDEERRRLERNLHDGAQQHLVAIKVKLGLAEMLVGRDPEKAKLTLDELKSDADEALETLRDLARGIYPPLLADRGLQVALAAQARKATVPVAVEADGIGRYSPEIEAAVYFCCLEALQNVQKYAGASSVIVRLRVEDHALRFDVEDDGAGFDVAIIKRGAGLTNMADRLDALGGTLHVNSSIGQGTTIAGSLGTAPVTLLESAAGQRETRVEQ